MGKDNSIQEIAIKIVQYSLMTITGLTAEKITSFEKITDEFKDSIVSINLELASVTEEFVKVAGEEVAYDSSSLVLIAEDGTGLIETEVSAEKASKTIITVVQEFVQQTLIINSVETLKSIITKTKSITESEEGSISCSEFTSNVETIMGLVNSEGPANEIQALVAQLGS